jgi:hypothetical protein
MDPQSTLPCKQQPRCVCNQISRCSQHDHMQLSSAHDMQQAPTPQTGGKWTPAAEQTSPAQGPQHTSCETGQILQVCRSNTLCWGQHTHADMHALCRAAGNAACCVCGPANTHVPQRRRSRACCQPMQWQRMQPHLNPTGELLLRCPQPAPATAGFCATVQLFLQCPVASSCNSCGLQ